MNYGKHKDILLSDSTSQPLTSEDQSKLLIFALLMLPTIPIVLIGVIPTIFLGFGLYMMKKNQDFSSVDVAVRNFKYYTYVCMFGSFITLVVSVFKTYRYESEIVGSLMCLVAAFVYSIAIEYFFYKPLKSHSDWVSVNGIFNKKPKDVDKSHKQLNLDIIKGERLKQYSVADELLKWAKLKEDGHITEAEFNEAREKLLKKS